MKLCAVQGCEGLGYSKGFCGKHYARLKRHGDPMTVTRRQVNGTPAERLAAKSRLMESGCIEYTARLRSDGYAHIRVGTRYVLAHRLAYELAKGPIPEGAEIRHMCDNRACVNPVHLEPGTRQENVDDCTSQKRHNWGQRSGRSKLVPAQVYEIRESTGTAPEVAARFGITAKTVNQIRNRSRWAHLPERITA